MDAKHKYNKYDKKSSDCESGRDSCEGYALLSRNGDTSVAVFSEADRTARHVLYADDAVLIGPAASKDSYLNIEKIIRAAKQHKWMRFIPDMVSCPRMRILPAGAKKKESSLSARRQKRWRRWEIKYPPASG